MKFRCDCGTIIRDQTDFLPYKARFIADQDFFDLLDALDAEVEQVVARMRQAVIEDADAAQGPVVMSVNTAHKALRRAMWKYAERAMYQCSHCGRLILDDNLRSPYFQSFVPADDEVPKAMLRSVEGDRWKRPIYAEWTSERPWAPEVPPGRLIQGDFVVLPDVGVAWDAEHFDAWEALEARYYEVVERARAEGTLRSALLRKDAELVHTWPPHDEREESATQEYTIEIDAETWAPREWNPPDDNTDVTVAFADGAQWAATFFSYANIAALTEKYRQTGENLHGRYFCTPNMILVDEVSRQRIEEVIAHLIETWRFEQAFRRV